jgi:hypothetical protein
MNVSAALICGAMALCGAAAIAGPLTFKTHALATACYSASNMRVTYGSYRTSMCAKPAREKVPQDDVRILGAAVSLRAYAGSLQVEWKTRNGAQLSETLDLAKIFNGRTILHQEDPHRIDPSLPTSGDPTIVVEVNDKTLTVYMDVEIVLLASESGTARRSSRNRLVALQKTFN